MATQKIDMDGLKIVTEKFRLSYPNLFIAKAVPGSPVKRFGCQMLWDKKEVTRGTLEAPVIKAIRAKWGPNKAQWPKGLRLPFRDGDKPYKGEIKPEHKGMWVGTTSVNEDQGQPFVVAKNYKTPLMANQIYPGCYCVAAVVVWPYDTAGNQGVTYILEGVAFQEKGEPLGGRRSAEQAFGALMTDDDESEDGDTNLGGVGVEVEDEDSQQDSFI